MTAPITGMYCDRCGARHEFERAKPSGVARLRELTRGVRGYVLNETPTFGDAMTDAWSRLEEDGALEQYAEVQKTFSFCLDCRGYVCHDCWNGKAGRCLTCVPLPGMESVAESAIADRLDLVAGPAPEASPAPSATPPDAAPGPYAPAVETPPVEETAIPVFATGPAGPHDAAVEAEAPTFPLTQPDAVAPEGEAGATAEPRADAAAGATPTAVLGRSRQRREARPTEPRRADEDADVIAAAVAAGIIVAPAAPSPAAPEPEAAVEAAAEASTGPEVVETPVEPQAPLAQEEAAAIAAPVAPEQGVAESPVTTPSAVSEPEPTPAPIVAVAGWPSDLGTPASAAATETVTPQPAGAPFEPAAAPPAIGAPAGSAPAADVVPVAEPSPTQPTAAPEAAAASAQPVRRGDRRRPAPPPRRAPAPVLCRQCGLQVPAVARFCRRCGERQTGDVAARA